MEDIAPYLARNRDPIQVKSAADVQWDATADVVVVGFGGSGMAAAIEAREQGASVIALDRFGGGGSTSVSGGIIYAGGTEFQKQAGFDDTSEEMFKYLKAEGVAVDDETLRTFCEGSAGDISWLQKHGLKFGSNAFLDKTNYPPEGSWLYYSGNEKLYADRAKPAPRGHRPVGTGFSGQYITAALGPSALALGVELIKHAPVERLVVDPGGAGLGVKALRMDEAHWAAHSKLNSIVDPWRPFNNKRAETAIAEAIQLEAQGKPIFIRATNGVILTAGGFIYNRRMVSSHQPVVGRALMNTVRLGTMGDDGSGIELGVSAGAGTRQLSHISIARTIAPPDAFAHGVPLNSDGARFVNEAAYATVVGGAIARQGKDGEAWLILDGPDFWAGFKWALHPPKGMFFAWAAPVLLNILLGGARRARSVEKLASKIGVDPVGLSETIQKVRRAARGVTPDEFGKSATQLASFEGHSFFALNVSTRNKFAPAITMSTGGLAIDERTGAVIRPDGTVIEGLHAAGRSAVGLISNGFVSGLAIADVIFGGRRAGRNAALGSDATPANSHNLSGG